MSKHSDREARIVRAYLRDQPGVNYVECVMSNGHYIHMIEFNGERVTYTHGGSRPNERDAVFVRNARSGVQSSMIRTRRQALADQWAGTVH